MFNETDNGQTQYCPMCQEWAEKYEKLNKENNEYKSLLEWLLAQQYYILHSNIKKKIKGVLNNANI